MEMNNVRFLNTSTLVDANRLIILKKNSNIRMPLVFIYQFVTGPKTGGLGGDSWSRIVI